MIRVINSAVDCHSLDNWSGQSPSTLLDSWKLPLRKQVDRVRAYTMLYMLHSKFSLRRNSVSSQQKRLQ